MITKFKETFNFTKLKLYIALWILSPILLVLVTFYVTYFLPFLKGEIRAETTSQLEIMTIKVEAVHKDVMKIQADQKIMLEHILRR